MLKPANYSFHRYLAAKKTVDDRALNRQVWDTLARALPSSTPEAPLRVLEIGAGIGAMLERMIEWGLLTEASYTGIDARSENITQALDRLPAWGAGRNIATERRGDNLDLRWPGGNVTAAFEAIDLFDFVQSPSLPSWDLLVAHAFLDLVNLPSTLPLLFRLLAPHGMFAFTLNFDGETVFEPSIDPSFDELVMHLYHRSMDERITTGCPSGDSHTGRHLFHEIQRAGGKILAAGASDWVVFPGPDGYPGDDSYFLHHILSFFENTLSGYPGLNPRRLSDWLEKRHAQVECGELVYIAHQLDFVGMI